MIVKSFGCSFTWGSDLSDEDAKKNIFSNLTWPALVANHVKCDYNCFAWPGIGNFLIASSVLNQCAVSGDNDLFIINWTYIDRFDYVPMLVNPKFSLAFPSNWQTCRPGDNSDYFKKYHSEFRDKLVSLQAIKLCIDTLLQRKIKFIMTALDDLMFDQRWHMSPGIELLQEYTQPYITTFDGQTLVDYANNLGHKRISNGHISEQAHYDAAQYMINFLDKQNIIDC